MMRKLLLALMAMTLCSAAHAAASGQISTDLNIPFPVPTVLNSTVSVRTDGFDWSSAELIVTSATIGAVAFSDGQLSSATIKVTSAPVGGIPYPGTICVAGVCATYGIGLSPTATGQYVYPYDQYGVSSNTAQGICNWILGNNQLQTEVTCSAPGGQSVVYTTATIAGFNYALYSSSQAAITMGSSNLTITGATSAGFSVGGGSSSYIYNGTTIYLPSHKFGTGLAVFISTAANPSQNIYYSTASVGGTITRLAPGTTYYSIAVDANDIGLSLTSTGAVAGAYLNFTSSASLTATDTFTMNAVPLAGQPTLTWVISNDNTNWVPFTTTTFGQTITSPIMTLGGTGNVYTATGTVRMTDFGHLNYSWIGVSVSSITTGGLNITGKIAGSTP